MTGPGSLIQAAADADRAAPPFSFFSEVQEEAEKCLAESGEFTGERLFRDRPAVYAAAVRMIAEGQSISATARALGISRNTVAAVRDREGVSIEQDKKELLRDLRRASRLGVEKVIELLPETKAAKDAAIVAAVMVDKMQLLSGEATSRVERVETKPDQVKAFLDSLPVVEGEVLEVISTGVPGETAGQKAAGLEAAVPALPAPLSDSVSDDPAGSDTVDEACRTDARTTAGSFETAPDAADDGAGRPGDGGGGGAFCFAPAPRGIDTEKQNFGQRAICSVGGRDETRSELGGVSETQSAAAERGVADGGLPAASHLCKRTKKKQGGGPKRSPAKPVSPKAPTSQKKKGGSGC